VDCLGCVTPEEWLLSISTDGGAEVEKQKHGLGWTDFMKCVPVLRDLMFCLSFHVLVLGIMA